MMVKIIPCVTIVFFIVQSSANSPTAPLNGGPKAVCEQNVSRSQVRYDPFNKQVSQNLLINLQTDTVPVSEQYETVWNTKKICCPGYEEKSRTCTPKCSESCGNGYCATPNICKCNDHWEGSTCNKPRFCTVAKSTHANLSATVTELPDPEYSKDATEESPIEWTVLPECLSDCLDQVAINHTQSGNLDYYYIPIHSSCNNVAGSRTFWKKYQYAVGSAIGIMVLTIIICIVCIVQRKRSLNNMSNEHSDAEYDYVDLRQIYDSKSPYSTCK